MALLLYFHTIPGHGAGQMLPLIDCESCRSLLKTWMVLIYLYRLKCSGEEALLLIPRVLHLLSFSPSFSVLPHLYWSPQLLSAQFKCDMPEGIWRCDGPARICRRPNYSPVTVLAGTGAHPEHCTPPGSFWSSISLA